MSTHRVGELLTKPHWPFVTPLFARTMRASCQSTAAPAMADDTCNPQIKFTANHLLLLNQAFRDYSTTVLTVASNLNIQKSYF